MKKFTYVELFAGIGGVTFGFDAVGGNCVMASEIDKYAAQSYKALHSHVDLKGDVTQIDERDVPFHDILSFTSPCQAFSVSGKRLGFEDTRGTLTFEALRIAKEKRPKALFMENVKGLLGHDNRNTLTTIINAMNDIGYVVDFAVLNSNYFEVPHNRQRLYIVALREDLIEQTPWVNLSGNTNYAKIRRELTKKGTKTFNFNWPIQNAKCEDLSLIMQTEVDNKFYFDDARTTALLSTLSDSEKVVGSIGHHPFSKKKEFSGYKSTVSPCLIATDYKAPKTYLETASTIRKITPLEALRLQSFPDSVYADLKDLGISDSQLYKQAGNAVTVNVIKAIGERLNAYI